MKKLLSVLIFIFISTSIHAQIGFERIVVPQDVLSEYVSFPGDVDGDGDMDYIALTVEAENINWHENLDGNGTFGEAQPVSTIGNIWHFGTADLDGDGDADVVSTDRNIGLYWHENVDGQGSFVAHVLVVDMYEYDDIDWVSTGDMDNDGNVDIIFRMADYDLGHYIGWFRNLGSGSFSEAMGLFSTFNTEEPFIGDMDGDGDLDMLTTKTDTYDWWELWYHENDGAANFSGTKLADYFDIAINDIHGADIDGDGDMEAFHMSNGFKWNENVDGSFGSTEIFPGNITYVKGLRSADLDGDGDQDFIFEPYNTSTPMFWSENEDGLGSFGSPMPIAETEYVKNIRITDFNNDGNVDFYAAGYNQMNAYKNVGPIGNLLSGRVGLDLESDGCDDLDRPLQYLLVTTNNGTNTFSTFTNNLGAYDFELIPGEFVTTVTSPQPEYFDINPISHTSIFPDLVGEDEADFCLQPNQTINDLSIVVYASQDPRPGFEFSYLVVYNNVGTTELSGAISFNFDGERLNFIEANVPVTSETDNTLTFDVVNFEPFQRHQINLQFLVEPPPITEIGDVLVADVQIEPIDGDITPMDNVSSVERIVVGSYDPNDILVLEGEEIYLAEADDYLHYMIRFQNTGTADAINVHVTNILDDDLDWNTLQLESLSHEGIVEIIDGNEIDFIFDNIHLPDSTTNEPDSHGFITYKIKPKSPATLGDVFTNSASIYFDFNPPVITNTVTTTIVENLSVSDNRLNELKLFPNPTNGLLNIQSNSEIVSVEVLNQIGQLVVSENNFEGINSINIQQLQQGMYFIKLKDIQGNSMVKKLIKE